MAGGHVEGRFWREGRNEGSTNLEDGGQELSEVASAETAALLTEAVSPPRSRGWLDG